MLISIGLELDNEGRALAWALDFPGCFAYGAEGPEAVIGLARELVTYEDWIARHAGPQALQISDFDLRVVDTWQVYTVDDAYNVVEGGYAVNAWFRQDWKPLAGSEIERGLDLLRWSREDFLRVIGGIGEEQLDRQRPGERWSIRGIAKHVANAEWWYLDRLGLAEGGSRAFQAPLTPAEHGRESLPRDTIERLAWVRQHLNAILPNLEGRELVLGKEGEFWSPRKLLRRVLWHEINHRQHILKLIQQDEG